MSIIEREREATEVLTEREQRARTLEGAALEIEMRGWCQRARHLPNGAVCAVGGMQFALGGSASAFDVAVYGVVDRIWGRGKNEPTVDHWNDAEGRTAEQVTFLLRWRAEEIRDGWDHARTECASPNPVPEHHE